ncbi:N-acetyl-gamma-glutamyl-phosphate reductase [Anaerobacterium chartisolvens]|uniref:N-acetyl-gamma-glutamyl-phosphate reductase n=1 Tax=Anaerobacterium chartisolvens TaxID=1297424 RepID=A0A369BF56_9FIRM|nr:N-acetyl-gamma-glutamyl-phosphate reductase [Anaerobacterium chartisolvens]RCX18324.1 N-acetyl-gamma-glutamyl-phosphate reductase [Anaerobacterium chartisolvens]
MKHKIFVDGQEGTTGLKINERLNLRDDVIILKIDPQKRKDTSERKRLLNEADIVFLCLPDAAARESVSLVENDRTRIIDASTAHRTDDRWAYGLAELSAEHRKRIKSSMRVSVPGCFATGFNAAVYPLVKEGIIPSDYPLTCHSVSGYSGGGKKLIEQYEDITENSERLKSPRFYSLGLTHKHLPEMQKVCSLDFAPLFTPIVSCFYQGMSVAVPIMPRLLPKRLGAAELQEFFSDYYKNEHFIRVMPYNAESNLDNGYLGAEECNGTNYLHLFVFGNDDRILLLSRLDNLGKGASGAAVQNMNIMLGIDEKKGLDF